MVGPPAGAAEASADSEVGAAAPSVEVVPVEAGNVCVKCGSPVARQAQFCPQCGNPVGSRPSARSSGRIWLVLGGIVLIVLAFGGCAVSGYNKAIDLKEEVPKRWGQVEVVLKRRFDLIPNLINTVKGSAGHEQEIFDKITAARAAYAGAQSTGDKAKAAGMLQVAMGRLLAIAEDNPELRANEAFLKLQDQLEGTENRIAFESGRYNEAVKDANAYRQKFPSRIWSGWAGLKETAYFEIPEEEKAVPKVEFD